MPSIKQIIGAVALGFVSVTSALPAQPKLSERSLTNFALATRQNPATGLPDGLTDVDVLQLYVFLVKGNRKKANSDQRPHT